jgi:hypothetical protein
VKVQDEADGLAGVEQGVGLAATHGPAAATTQRRPVWFRTIGKVGGGDRTAVYRPVAPSRQLAGFI